MKASLQQQPMYCSRDHNYSSRFNQQYEKPTQYIKNTLTDTMSRLITKEENIQLEPELEGHEFHYYVYDSLSDIKSVHKQ